MRKKLRKKESIPPIYIVSGGAGTSGAQVVNTVLAQFPDSRIPVITFADVHDRKQLAQAVSQAEKSGGTIVHTLVNKELRDELIGLAGKRDIAELDLMGPLLERLSSVLGLKPAGTPGLYRRHHEEYFKRIDAIEYTLDHDDGRNVDGWHKADVVLVGVSRSGKTPLSIYLSVQGWKTANYPVVPGVTVPDELFALDPQKVFGLTIDPDRLMKIRSQRTAQFGMSDQTAYSDAAMIEEEIRAARKIFRRGGFSVIDMTDRTIEACAAEIMKRIMKVGLRPPG